VGHLLRFALRAGFHRPARRAEHTACPLLAVVCDDDTAAPPTPAADAARRSPRGELLRLPGGHYTVYEGAGFDRAIAAQIAFLARRACSPPPADGARGESA